MLKVFLTDLAAYNKGFLIGKWLALPCDDTDAQIDAVLREGEAACAEELGYFEAHEEYFLTDWEWEDGEYLKISEYESLCDLNARARGLESLCKSDQARVAYLMEDAGLAFDQALAHYEEVVFYEDMELDDVACDMVDEGVFGAVSPRLLPYIDYYTLGRDLYYDGYRQTSKGVFYYG